MKFLAGAVVTLALLSSLPCRGAADDDLSQGYARVKPALVKVWAFNPRGIPIESGTGFVVRSDAHRSWIVTALHVVAHASKVTVDVDRRVHDLPATVVAKTSDHRDVALLLVPRGNLPCVRFEPRAGAIVEGKYVATAGYFKYDERIGVVGQAPQLVGPGTIGALPDAGRFIEVNLDLEPGLSGAPVFDPGTGDVVGIIETKSAIGQGGYAVSAPLIVLGFLNAHHVAVGAPPAPPPPRALVAVVAQPPAPAPVPTAPPAPVVRTAVVRTAIVPTPAAQFAPAGDPAPAAAPADLVRLYLDRAHADNARRQYDLAVADLSRVLTIDPNDAVAYNNRGFAYAEQGRYDLAIADLTQAVRLDPGYVIAYYNRGSAYASTERYDLAIADLTQALSLDPNDLIAYNRRGFAYLGKGRYDLAVADLSHAVLVDPDYALAYTYRGDAYSGEGRFDLAIADFDRALRIDPNLARAYIGRGQAYEKQGRSNLAIADYDSAVRLDPNQRNAILRISALYAR